MQGANNFRSLENSGTLLVGHRHIPGRCVSLFYGLLGLVMWEPLVNTSLIQRSLSVLCRLGQVSDRYLEFSHPEYICSGWKARPSSLTMAQTIFNSRFY